VLRQRHDPAATAVLQEALAQLEGSMGAEAEGTLAARTLLAAR
jgi:hypothetical protein